MEVNVDKVVASVLSSIAKVGERFQKIVEENYVLRGKVSIDMDTISIRKIKNGFVIGYSEGEPFEVESPRVFGVTISERDSDDMTGEPANNIEPAPEPQKQTFYKWHRVELFAKDDKEMAKLIPEALQALVLRDNVKEDDPQQTEGEASGFLHPNWAVGSPPMGSIGVGYSPPAQGH